MSQIAQLGFLAGRLLIESGLGISARGVGLVTALLTAKISCTSVPVLPEWIEQTLNKRFNSVGEVTEEIRGRATQTFARGLETFLKAKARSSNDGKNVLGFVVAGVFSEKTVVHVVTVQPGVDPNNPLIEVSEVCEGEFIAGETAAINKALADDPREMTRYWQIHPSAVKALSSVLELPKVSLELARDLVSYVALEAVAEPSRVGGGYTFAWTSEGENRFE
jgi:hypothetical protein